MKITTKEDKPSFKPVTIEITIESEEELAGLWHQLNTGMEHYIYWEEFKSTVTSKHDSVSKLFWEINNIAEARNYVQNDENF